MEPEDFHKYAFTQIRFQGITNEHGEATIKPEPRFSSSKDVMQYTKEGLPPDAFEIKVRIDDDKDFDLRTGKKLGSVTIVNKAVELEFDLKDFPSRFSSY